MPWEKQFDVDNALEMAMAAFWSRGYEATSMQDLVDRMGINRASIYATFGDKRSLFIKAVRHYDRVQRLAWLSELAETMQPLEAILAAFEDAISYAVDRGGRDGCLLVNTALEMSPHDKAIAEVVAHGLEETERFFTTMIERGQLAGDVPQHIDATETGRALLSLFIGLRVLSRSRPDEALLRSIAQQARVLVT